MVGKRRLNQRRRMGSERGWDDSPFRCSAVGLSIDGASAAVPFLPLRNVDVLNLDVLNQSRKLASSMGRRSACQSRKLPPARNARPASQTPATGERRPCFAKETPIKESE